MKADLEDLELHLASEREWNDLYEEGILPGVRSPAITLHPFWRPDADIPPQQPYLFPRTKRTA